MHLEEKYNKKEEDKDSINSEIKSENQSDFSFSEEESVDVPTTADKSYGKRVKKS